MVAQTYLVKLSVEEARQLIVNTAEGGSITGECIDEYRMDTPNGKCIVMVFEKYYMRVGNRLTLTVVVDDFDGLTRVHSASGGGGNSVMFRFDWGAGDSMASALNRALQPYIA